MQELGQREVEAIQRLVLDPTPANYQAITAHLEAMAANFSRRLLQPEALARDAAPAGEFLRNLPVELSRLRALMQAPLVFYQKLGMIHAAHFGAYERSGELRSLAMNPLTRTIVHL